MSFSISIYKKYSSLNLQDGKDAPQKYAEKKQIHFVREECVNDDPSNDDSDEDSDEQFAIDKRAKCPFCHEAYAHFILGETRPRKSPRRASLAEKNGLKNMFLSKSTIEIDVRPGKENAFHFNFVDEHKNELLRHSRTVDSMVFKNIFYFNIKKSKSLSSSSSSSTRSSLSSVIDMSRQDDKVR